MIYINGNTTVCTKKYKGKLYRATAVCHDEDTYNNIIGNELANARVDLKICAENKRELNKLLESTTAELYKLQRKLYWINSKLESNNAHIAMLEDLIADLKDGSAF